MSQQLWLLRHGEAVPHDSKPDAERELTARGERQATAAGGALARLGVEFAACYTSPKVRARDTARLACEALNVTPQETAVIASGFSADDALELLLAHGADARVLVVGHEPDLSRLLADLTGARADVKKGGIVAIAIERGSGTALVLLRPREIESIALGEPAGR
jgi:phosphohistidine phosphatase